MPVTCRRSNRILFSIFILKQLHQYHNSNQQIIQNNMLFNWQNKLGIILQVPIDTNHTILSVCFCTAIFFTAGKDCTFCFNQNYIPYIMKAQFCFTESLGSSPCQVLSRSSSSLYNSGSCIVGLAMTWSTSVYIKCKSFIRDTFSKDYFINHFVC